MLSEEDDVDIHALKRQGMTISEIACRTDHDRKPSGHTWPGNGPRDIVNAPNRTCSKCSSLMWPRGSPQTGTFGRWRCSTSCDRLRFAGSYQTLTRQVRDRSVGGHEKVPTGGQ